MHVQDTEVKIYAFDVDETLEISRGPVKIADMVTLKRNGEIVGICGNWAAFVNLVYGWQHLVSFISNPYDLGNISPGNKAGFLLEIKKYIPADDYVMVGNVFGISGASDDSGAAAQAGWRFIKESDFAEGAR